MGRLFNVVSMFNFSHYTKCVFFTVSQLGEFFDVIDETIQGYDMPRVVTELHAHFWDCGVDYRPKYLPLRTFVGIETLSISSNLVYESKESLLRWVQVLKLCVM